MTSTSCRFFAVAQQYCRLVETAHHLNLQDRVYAFAGTLADLYSAALTLPATDPATQHLLPSHRERLPHWPGFGVYESYAEVFDPYDPIEVTRTVLTDDLIDIYHDLKPGVVAYDTGPAESVTDAVWEWRFSFGTHWGDHAVDALRALHRAFVGLSGTGDQ